MKEESQTDLEKPQAEAVALVAYAGFWRRFFALFIDSIIVGILGTVVSFIIGASIHLNYLVAFLIAVLYFSLGFWGKVKGGTIGKRLLALRVIDLSGHGLNYGRAFLRSLPIAILLVSNETREGLPQLAYPLSIPTNIMAYAITVFVFLALLISVIFHPQKRGIHDMLAGTLCVKVAPAQTVSPIKVGTKLRIGLIVVAVASLAIGTFAAMPFEPIQEHPLMISLRDAGLIETAEFTTWNLSSSDLGKCTGLEVNVVVPSGTIDNEVKKNELMNRIATDLTFGPDIDIVMIKLVEQSKVGFFTSTRTETKFLTVVGKEDMFDRARKIWMQMPMQ